MSDFEASPPKEIEIDADGEGGEALLKKSPSPEPEPVKTNGKSSNSETRHRSRSRSRSRSRHRHHRSRRRYSRSRSKSPRYRRRHSRYSRSRSRGRRDYDYDRDDRYDRYDRYRSSFNRDGSRSPLSTRKRHLGDRENPQPSRCIGVFGLSLYTQERGLREVFGRYGQIDEVQVVYDRQTGRSRGFAFVYFKSADDAYEAKDRCNGIDIDGRRIRVDFSVTERAHTPTPGIYLGKPSDSPSGRSPGRRYSSSFRRSPSPYGSYGYHRGRSFTPPRKYY